MSPKPLSQRDLHQLISRTGLFSLETLFASALLSRLLIQSPESVGEDKAKTDVAKSMCTCTDDGHCSEVQRAVGVDSTTSQNWILDLGSRERVKQSYFDFVTTQDTAPQFSCGPRCTDPSCPSANMRQREVTTRRSKFNQSLDIVASEISRNPEACTVNNHADVNAAESATVVRDPCSWEFNADETGRKWRLRMPKPTLTTVCFRD